MVARLETKLRTWDCGEQQMELCPVWTSAAYDEEEVCPVCPSCAYEVTTYVGHDLDRRCDNWECQLCGHVFLVVID
jgi:hypothetical protein